MYYSAIGLLAIMILLIENHDILLARSAAFKTPCRKPGAASTSLRNARWRPRCMCIPKTARAL